MRTFSISEQSTRYCNFSKDKFGNEVTFILPSWVDEKQLGIHNSKTVMNQVQGFENWANTSEMSELTFLLSLAVAESGYFNLLNQGWKPQQARETLPLATATEVVYTAYISDWINFFKLRCSEAAHPSARELAIPLKEEFIKREYIKE